MKKIAIIPGDGIGVDVTREAVNVLTLLNEKCSLDLELVEFDFGAEKFLATGITFPKEQIEDFRKNYAAIFLGSITRLWGIDFTLDFSHYNRMFAAGLTATVLGGVAADWFFIPPRFSLQVSDVSQQIGIFIYAASSLTFVAFGHAMHRARQRAEELATGLRVTEERLTLAQQASQMLTQLQNRVVGLPLKLQ